jgi:hypothetical protein
VSVKRVRYRFVIGALLAVNALLIALIVQRVWQGTQVQILLSTAADPATVLLPPVFAADTVTNWAPLQDRALFHASRRYYVPPPSVSTLVAPPRPDYRLSGVMMFPGKLALALLLQNASGMTRKVKAGDELDGWRVQTVETGRLVLRYEQQTLEIVSPASSTGTGLWRTSIARAGPAGTRATGGQVALGPIMLGNVAPANAPAAMPTAGQTGPSEPADSTLLYRAPPVYRPPAQ